MSKPRALPAELRGRPMPALDTLDDAQIDTLAQLIREARQHQQQQLRHALDAALTHVPLLLRGAVRKILSP